MENVRRFTDVVAAPATTPWKHEQFLFHRGRRIPDVNTNFTNFRVNWIYQAVVQPRYQIPAPEKYVSKAVFGGWFHEQFGHFLTDSIARMWYFQREKDLDFYFFPMDLRHCRLSFRHIQEFQSVIGFRADQIKIIETPTMFGELVIPDRAFDQLLNPSPLLDTLAKGLNWTPGEVPVAKKVYFKRGDPRWSGEAVLLGEDSFERYIETQGYKVIDLVKTEAGDGRSISDQFEYIKNAETLIIPEGSAAYWTLLSQNSNKRMVILSRRPEWAIKHTQCTGKHMARACNKWIHTDCIEEIASYPDEHLWEHKTVALDWKAISLRLKALGLVDAAMQ